MNDFYNVLFFRPCWTQTPGVQIFWFYVLLAVHDHKSVNTRFYHALLLVHVTRAHPAKILTILWLPWTKYCEGHKNIFHELSSLLHLLIDKTPAAYIFSFCLPCGLYVSTNKWKLYLILYCLSHGRQTYLECMHLNSYASCSAGLYI